MKKRGRGLVEWMRIGFREIIESRISSTVISLGISSQGIFSECVEYAYSSRILRSSYVVSVARRGREQLWDNG